MKAQTTRYLLKIPMRSVFLGRVDNFFKDQNVEKSD